jgi:hypothetical protein
MQFSYVLALLLSFVSAVLAAKAKKEAKAPATLSDNIWIPQSVIWLIALVFFGGAGFVMKWLADQETPVNAPVKKPKKQKFPTTSGGSTKKYK